MPADIKTPVGDAPVIPLLLLGIGGYLAWFGVHYFGRGGWPTAPVKSVLTGQGVPAPGAVTLTTDQQAVETSAKQLAAAQQQLTTLQGVTPGTGQSNPDAVGQAVAAGAGTTGSNEQVMQQVAASFGWTGPEWTALYNVEMREAGFSLTATNPTSGAYGMAQFINGPSEYAQYGGNSTTAFGQSVAMCNYIKQRYGTPIAAWAHEQEFGWY
jgi:hypothetical protein